MGVLPFIPAPDLSPDLILPLVLSPPLFATTRATTVRELRSAARPILTSAVGLTLASAAAVALVAQQVSVPRPAAIMLGAIVAPLDPVAASAVASRLNLPSRRVTILEGEGQLNDATALVVHQLAIMAAVTGTVTAAPIGDGLALAVLGGIAVLVPGLFLRSKAHSATTADGSVLGRAVWRHVERIASGLLFAYLGSELTSVLRSTPLTRGLDLPLVAGCVIRVLVVVRTLEVFAATASARRRARAHADDGPATWREASVVSWAGMRGVVTVATALALLQTVDSGAAFPARDDVVLVALVVVLARLVAQGLTFAPLVAPSWPARGPVGRGRRHRGSAARALAAPPQAALDRLVSDAEAGGDETPKVLRDVVVESYQNRLGSPSAAHDAVQAGGSERASELLRALVLSATETERDVVLDARRSGEVSPAVADAALLDIETRALQAGADPRALVAGAAVRR